MNKDISEIVVEIQSGWTCGSEIVRWVWCHGAYLGISSQ